MGYRATYRHVLKRKPMAKITRTKNKKAPHRWSALRKIGFSDLTKPCQFLPNLQTWKG